MAGYYPTIPEIAKAFENDPRTRLSRTMLDQGTSMAPANGGWAEGIARALQGTIGGYIQGKRGREYKKREDEQTRLIAEAFNQPSEPTGLQQAPQAPSAPLAASGSAGLTPPQGPDLSGQGVPRPLTPVDPDASFQRPPQRIPSGNPLTPPGPAPQTPSPMDPRTLFRSGIVPIEGGTDRNGKFLTSPKGAYGPSQLMPGTAPEAMALAGYSRDDQSWRTNPEVNLAAGEAYYTKQLQDFGDPIKAAAAYNAGPGRVQRSMRRAAKEGGSWTDYLPGETKAYIRNFAAKVGDGAAATGAPQAPMNTPAQMENVPEGLRDPGAAPTAPTARPAVQSNKLRIGQFLLKSGNPDVQALGLKLVQEGQDQQFQADSEYEGRAERAANQAYRTQADDWGNARAGYRDQARDDRRGAIDRNFNRENREDQQAYGTSERIAGQQYGTSERVAGQQYRTSERVAGEQFSANEADKDRKSKEATAAQKRADRIQGVLSTPTGMRIANEVNDRIQNNNATVAALDRFLALNEQQSTGGVNAIPGVARVRGALGDDEIAQMLEIANKTTINDSSILKGSLSDSDRKFVQDSQPGPHLDRKTNTAIINARKGALQRQNDFELGKLEAMATGETVQFMQQWQQYVKSVSVKDANAPSFQEWKSGNVVDYTGRK